MPRHSNAVRFGRKRPDASPVLRCNLHAVRIKRKVTQRRIAEALGVSGAAVSHWERHGILPAPANLARLCALLRCTARDLWPDVYR
jgi:transcriptional regulator with XRE-family HTH domain